MNVNQYIYDKMSSFLKDNFKEELIEYDEGCHLTIGDTGFWIAHFDHELTIGLGMNHMHYDFNYHAIEDAVDTFFLLLTKRKKITEFLKGSKVFKAKVEIELENGDLIDFGTTAILPLQFWKKVASNITYQQEFISTEKCIEHWKALIDYAENIVKNQ